jgi:nitroreductase
MEFFETIEKRRSIRKYKNTPVEKEKIEQVLNAARLAPSWKNMQCWRFLVIESEEKRKTVVSALPDNNPCKKGLSQAPIIILICADPKESEISHGIEYYIADASIAFEHICLAATAIGLGTCWIGLFNEEELKNNLKIPDNIRIVGLTPLGYPEYQPNPRPRKELSEITYYETWPDSQQ